MLFFNGFRQSLLRLPPNLQQIARDLTTTGRITTDKLPVTVTPFFSTLVEGGFFVKDDVNELNLIRKRYRTGREGGSLNVLITTTLRCNLACTYCYQERAPVTMGRTVIDGIERFVNTKIREGADKLHVDWFGGEPLLARNVIVTLTERFRKLTTKYGCSYGASIATNGTLLDEKTTDLLLKCGVNDCQVTIDGPRDIHDSRRGFQRGRKSSFDIIFKNLIRLVGSMDLFIRINVDSTTIERAYELLDTMEKSGILNAGGKFKILPYVALTGPLNTAQPMKCLSMDKGEFYSEHLAFRKVVFEKTGREYLDVILDFPTALDTPCGALRERSYAFDPKGRYFKCGLEIGELGKHCGDVFGGVNSRVAEWWERYDPIKTLSCAECKYLPFCMGGCPKIRLDNNKFYLFGMCMYWNNNLESIIKTYAKAIDFKMTESKLSHIDQ